MKKPQATRNGMTLHYEIVELGKREEDLEKQLNDIREKRRGLEGELASRLGERRPGASTVVAIARRRGRKPGSKPKKEHTNGKRENHTDKVLNFLRAKGGKAVPFDVIREEAWTGGDGNALSRTLNGLKNRGAVKRMERKQWAAVAMASA